MPKVLWSIPEGQFTLYLLRTNENETADYFSRNSFKSLLSFLFYCGLWHSALCVLFPLSILVTFTFKFNSIILLLVSTLISQPLSLSNFVLQSLYFFVWLFLQSDPFAISLLTLLPFNSSVPLTSLLSIPYTVDFSVRIFFGFYMPSFCKLKYIISLLNAYWTSHVQWFL